MIGEPSALVLMLHCIDLGAKPPPVCLAQPKGLGARSKGNCRANGPNVCSLEILHREQTAGPLALTLNCTKVPARQAGLGKMLDLWSVNPKTVQHQKALAAC